MNKELPSMYTGPGLVDLQVNGYAGLNFLCQMERWTGELLHHARQAMRRRGVTASLPTFVTAPIDDLIARARRYGQLVSADAELAAAYPRLHIEGPFISPQAGPRGAHPRAHVMAPSAAPDLIDRIQEACGGRVGIVTVAPETDGAIDLIQRIRRQGICPAIGHTQASDEVIRQAVDAGALLATHLGNGSHLQLPRLANYIQTLLAEDRLYATFIADGHHMPLTTLKNFLRAKTFARSILITDAIAAAEMEPGEYPMGEDTVVVEPSGRASIPGQDNLAGSTLTLDGAILNVVRHCGVPLDEAWTPRTRSPCPSRATALRRLDSVALPP